VIPQCSEFINRCSSERILVRSNADDVSALVHAISNASIIIDGFAGSLEERWTIYDSKISHDKQLMHLKQTRTIYKESKLTEDGGVWTKMTQKTLIMCL
jgi:hypothetical protein